MKKGILNVSLNAGCATSPAAQQHNSSLDLLSLLVHIKSSVLIFIADNM